MIKASKRYEGHAKPEKFNQDIVVSEAGTGGLFSASFGKVVKPKVTLTETGEVDFAKPCSAILDVIAKIEPHNSVECYFGLGINVIKREGRIASPLAVEVNGETRDDTQNHHRNGWLAICSSMLPGNGVESHSALTPDIATFAWSED